MQQSAGGRFSEHSKIFLPMNRRLYRVRFKLCISNQYNYGKLLPPLPSLLRPSTLHFIPRNLSSDEKIPNCFGIFYCFLIFSTILILFFFLDWWSRSHISETGTLLGTILHTHVDPYLSSCTWYFFNQSGLPFWILSQIQFFRSSLWSISQKLVIRASISISLIVHLANCYLSSSLT